MRKKIPWEWEILDEQTQRVKVIGGWIVQSFRMVQSSPKPVVNVCSSVFVSDRDHEWIIVPPMNNTNPAIQANDMDLMANNRI